MVSGPAVVTVWPQMRNVEPSTFEEVKLSGSSVVNAGVSSASSDVAMATATWSAFQLIW